VAKERAKAFKYTGGLAPHIVDDDGTVLSYQPSEFIMGAPARDLDEQDIAGLEPEIYDMVLTAKATHGGLLYEERKSERSVDPDAELVPEKADKKK
jgi:hypothetical protein